MNSRINDYLFSLLLCLTGMLLMSSASAGQPSGHDRSQHYASLTLSSTHENKPSLRHAAGGVMRYTPRGPEFRYRLEAHGLLSLRNYTLLYLPDPFPGQGLLCLGNATSSVIGRLHMQGAPDLNSNLPVSSDRRRKHGARIVLVLSEDVDCSNRLMLTWDQGPYLFGRRLIRYHDTNIVTVDYSGSYCLVMEQGGSISSTEMLIAQSGSELTVSTAGVSVSGVLSGQSVTLVGTTPEGESFTMVLLFAAGGASLTGTLTTAGETISLSANRDRCTDYEFPAGEPQCIQPIADTRLVTGVQQFHTIFDGVIHTGVDFGFADTQPAVVAPCDGVVTEINRQPNLGGDILYHVTIKYNDEWETFLAFEPYSTDPAVADQQAALLAVGINQVVHRGDLVGYLYAPVPSTTTQILHWQVQHGNEPAIEECPYNFLTPAGQAELDALFDSFHLLPVCLDLP